MKKILMVALFLCSSAVTARAMSVSLPQDLNGRLITDVSMVGSLQAARTYSYEVGASTTGATLYTGPALFYGICASNVGADDNFTILRDSAPVVAASGYNLFGAVGFQLDISVVDQGLRCVTFPVPIRLERGLWWKNTNVGDIGANQVVTFFLLGL